MQDSTPTISKLTHEEILKHWPTHGALWLMEDPDLLRTQQDAFWKAAKNSTDEHIQFLEEMSRSSVIPILQEVARNPYTPVEILPSFLTNPYCVDQLLWNPASPSELIEKAFYATRSKHLMGLTFDHYEGACIAVSQHPNSGAKILDYAIRLVRDVYTMVNLVNHPNTPQETLEWVLTTSRERYYPAHKAAREKLARK